MKLSPKHLLRSAFTLRILTTILVAYGRLVLATSRVNIQGPLPATSGPILLASWHQQLFMVPLMRRVSPYPLLTLSSGSRDGTFISNIATHFGIGAVVGSSHRGGVAGARALLQAARSGHSLFITPDGPRGPARKSKPGATEVSRLAKLPLIPCAGWSKYGHTFNSWDNFRLPYPFNTITIVYGAALTQPESTALDAILNTLTAQAQTTAKLAMAPTKL